MSPARCVPVINLVIRQPASIMPNPVPSGSSDWVRETAGDLAAAEKTLSEASSSLSGEPDESQMSSIWEAYVLVEKSVAFIKAELGDENPGRFVNPKVYAVPDERQAVGFALRHLRTATETFGAGRLPESLKALRESRNYLRVLIRRKRLLRARNARTRGA